MADRRSDPGQIGCYASLALAALAHIVLLWCMPDASTNPAPAAAAITWELITSEPAAVQPASADALATAHAIPEPSGAALTTVARPQQARTPAAPARRPKANLRAVATDSASTPANPGAHSNTASADPEPSTRAAANAAEVAPAKEREPRAQDAAATARASSDLPSATALEASLAQGADALKHAAGAPDTALAQGADTLADAPGALDASLAQGAGALAHAHGAASARLERAPRLLAARDPCAGYFPGASSAKHGQVQLAIDVDAQGHAHAREVLLELPRGEGFESAAKACAAQLHFAPALDSDGHPVSGHARIALRFERT